MKNYEERVNREAAWLRETLNNQEGMLNFPTCFQSAVRLKNILTDPTADNRRVVTAIASDPLTAARVVHLANTPKYYRGSPVSDIGTAINRVGITTVNRLAVAVALRQLSISKSILEHHALSRKIWQHSLMTASAAFVVSKECEAISSSEAEFAGLVSNLGAFYILHRAATNPLIADDTEKINRLVNTHYEEAGIKILRHLEIPEQIIDSIETSHMRGTPYGAVPRTMREVIYISQAVADEKHQWRQQHQSQPGFSGSNFSELAGMIEVRSEENRRFYE